MSTNPFAHLDPNSPSKKKAWENNRSQLERLFNNLNQAAFGGKCKAIYDVDTGKMLLIPNFGIALIKSVGAPSVETDFHDDTFRVGASLCVCPAPIDDYFRFVLTTWNISWVRNIHTRSYVGVQHGPHQQYYEVRADYEAEIIKKISDLARTMLDHLRANECI